MPVTEDEIRESLKQVIDPELFVNIIDLGLVYNVTTHSAPPPAAAEGEAAEAAAIAAPAEGPPTPESEAGANPAPATGKTNVKIEMTLTSPACPAGPQIIAQSKTVLGRLEGVGDVEVRLVMVPPWTPARMSEDAKDQLGIFE